MNNRLYYVLFSGILILSACSGEQKNSIIQAGTLKTTTAATIITPVKDRIVTKPPLKDSLMMSKVVLSQYIPTKDSIAIKKDFLYTQYTLADVYPYNQTTRKFQWDKIGSKLKTLDSLRLVFSSWAILQNYKNGKGTAPLTQNHHLNEFKHETDSYGVERNQNIPLYPLTDTIQPVRYGRDGSPVRYIKDSLNFTLVETLNFKGKWLVPKKYVKLITITVDFKKAIMVDKTNQNITTLEKQGADWLVRSMNPATTGRHKPPYQDITPTGVFVIQEKKSRMNYLRDGSSRLGGFSPYASRFCNGAYLHGVPVNLPRKKIIEYSYSLGTTPRSHMCVRNATSHALFIYNWETPENTFVFVFD